MFSKRITPCALGVCYHLSAPRLVQHRAWWTEAASPGPLRWRESAPPALPRRIPQRWECSELLSWLTSTGRWHRRDRPTRAGSAGRDLQSAESGRPSSDPAFRWPARFRCIFAPRTKVCQIPWVWTSSFVARPEAKLSVGPKLAVAAWWFSVQKSGRERRGKEIKNRWSKEIEANKTASFWSSPVNNYIKCTQSTSTGDETEIVKFARKY